MASKFQPVTVQAPKCLNDFALQPNSRFKLESILYAFVQVVISSSQIFNYL